MDKKPKRLKAYRKHERRRAEGWRRTMKRQEEMSRRNAAGPEGEFQPHNNSANTLTPEGSMNRQATTGRFSNDYTR